MSRLNSRQLQLLDMDSVRVEYTRKKPRPRGVQPTHAERQEILQDPTPDRWGLDIPDSCEHYRPEYG